MRTAALKELVERYNIDQLKQAEEALLDEQTPDIDLGPDEPGDQLTHVIGAIEIKKQVLAGTDEKTALRNFIQRVRNSIS